MTRKEKYNRTRKRTIQRANVRALRIIRKFKFATAEDAKKKLPLVFHGEGAFRKSYRIAGTSLLIKFPVTQANDGSYGYWSDRAHTRSEVRKIRMLAKYKSLRPHVPPVYYFDSKNGVIVTRFYPATSELRTLGAMRNVLTKVIREFAGVVLEDLSGDNATVTRRTGSERGRLIFLDLGY